MTHLHHFFEGHKLPLPKPRKMKVVNLSDDDYKLKSDFEKKGKDELRGEV